MRYSKNWQTKPFKDKKAIRELNNKKDTIKLNEILYFYSTNPI